MGENANPDVKTFFEKGMMKGTQKKILKNKAEGGEKGSLLSSHDFELEIEDGRPKQEIQESDKRK